ncbi:hypothetical protein THARTR1_09859 [Trichoderma harzianum]|uniref:Uncharacterized protein n=1 Tax=Trichoderma harzianum TaxID=5544 RepID=A0A2K0TVI6_TRIHA|nr:hypothetical protein THARTR1_09859 [Trichoderma harzianum]
MCHHLLHHVVAKYLISRCAFHVRIRARTTMFAPNYNRGWLQRGCAFCATGVAQGGRL